MNLNIADILIVLITGFFSFRGVYNGFLKEASFVVASYTSLIIGKNYYFVLSKLFYKYFGYFKFSNIVSFFIIILMIFLSVKLLTIILKKVMNFSMLGWVDKSLGAIFGFVKSAIFICLIILFLDCFFVETKNKLAQDSYLISYYIKTSEYIQKQIPTFNLKDTYKKTIDNEKIL